MVRANAKYYDIPPFEIIIMKLIFIGFKTITFLTFDFKGISNYDGAQSNCKSHWADLTPEFRKKHYLVGLVLSHLSNAFNHV